MRPSQRITEFQTIIYEKRGGIGYVTLNRPQVLNIYNVQMRDELYQVLGAMRDDREVVAVILGGAGERAFCAGADLSEFLSAPSPAIARQVRWERDVWGLFLSLPQPVIAAVHGYVLGSGIEMALCCDIRIAAEDARFGLPEVSLGIIPAAGATQTLPRTIGRAKSLEMLLVGRWLDAEEALAAGLVNKVVPRKDLLDSAEAMARKIAALAPVAVRLAKEAIRRGSDMSLNEGLALERHLAGLLIETQDALEGVRAYVEGRSPNFQNRDCC
ncbi:MAG: enoyl-CoA hydratase/isomerase family protein [Chloroflexi bacterium]|nr:enoyl-CoA hydratase/isomerase family protein [Chloroflexota bacterium]